MRGSRGGRAKVPRWKWLGAFLCTSGFYGTPLPVSFGWLRSLWTWFRRVHCTGEWLSHLHSLMKSASREMFSFSWSFRHSDANQLRAEHEKRFAPRAASPLFAWRRVPVRSTAKTNTALVKGIAALAVVGSIIWAFRRLKKPRSQEMSARSYALRNICTHSHFFLSGYWSHRKGRTGALPSVRPKISFF